MNKRIIINLIFLFIMLFFCINCYADDYVNITQLSSTDFSLEISYDFVQLYYFQYIYYKINSGEEIQLFPYQEYNYSFQYEFILSLTYDQIGQYGLNQFIIKLYNNSHEEVDSLMCDFDYSYIPNQIETKQILVPLTDETAIATLNSDEYTHNTGFTDHMGRKLQEISVGSSPEGYDVVIPHVYDEKGLETRSYLPYIEDQSDGSYVDIDDALTNQAAFYDGTQRSIPEDTAPYSEMIMEDSPLNRVTEQGAPGADWQPASVRSQGKTLKKNISTNDTDEVRKWNAESGVEDGYYDEDELTITETIDENGNSSFEYIDKSGNTILKKTHKDTLDLFTYYVYDNKGNMTYIIPPKCYAEMVNSGNYNPNEFLDRYVTKFEYDNQKRLIRKYLPEMSGPIEYVYNIRDQIVMSCDPLQENRHQWLFTKYDVLGRQIISGIYQCDNNIPEELPDLQEEIIDCRGNNIYETRAEEYMDSNGDIINEYGYTDDAYPSLDHCRPLSVTYYDDYDFDFDGIDDHSYMNDPDQDGEFINNEPFMRVKGKVTGQITWIVQEPSSTKVYWGDNNYSKCYYKDFDTAYYKGDDITLVAGFSTSGSQEDDIYIGSLVQVPANPISEADTTLTVNFYDKYGRVIQTQSTNHLGNLDITFTQYDFSGKVLATKIIHNYDNSTYRKTIRKWYYYDHAQRLLSVVERVNEKYYVLLFSNEYNELGQLITKNLHGGEYSSLANIPSNPDFLQSVDYEYNIRGWLTNMNYPDNMGEDLFAMRLYYADEFTALSADEQYNGNITAMEWKSVYNDPGITGEKRAYGYQYDELNQLVQARYGEGSSYTGNLGCYDVRDLDYDENGNILNVLRFGEVNSTINVIDSLDYAYYGNRLISVEDGSTVNEGYHFNDGTTSGHASITDRNTWEYQYDQNGNLIHDANKNIDISYNHLNLPVVVDFGGGDRIEWVYDSTGKKLRKSFYANYLVVSSRDYVNGFEYETIGSTMTFNCIANEVGRLMFNKTNDIYEYIFDLKDHLGNVRLSFKADSMGKPAIVQQDHYYPFGMRLAGLSEDAGNDNKYLYNSKELEDYQYLHWYHYGARYYDPQLGRWMAIDPADQFNSPYAYCNNSPVMMNDHDGQTAYVFAVQQFPLKDVHLFIAVKNDETNEITTKGLYPESRTRVVITYLKGEEDNQESHVWTNRSYMADEKGIAEDILVNKEKVTFAALVSIVDPPEGMSDEEFDALILHTADNYPVDERPYDATRGWNSNTFVDWVIETCGGFMPDVPNATQQNYREEE